MKEDLDSLNKEKEARLLTDQKIETEMKELKDNLERLKQEYEEQAAALKQEATVYAFGIGSEINTDELEVFFVHFELFNLS